MRALFLLLVLSSTVQASPYLGENSTLAYSPFNEQYYLNVSEPQIPIYINSFDESFYDLYEVSDSIDSALHYTEQFDSIYGDTICEGEFDSIDENYKAWSVQWTGEWFDDRGNVTVTLTHDFKSGIYGNGTMIGTQVLIDGETEDRVSWVNAKTNKEF